MKFIIPGVPIAQKRARHARRGNFVTTYNPSSKEQGYIKLELHKQIGMLQECPLFCTGTPIAIELCFEMPIPKSFSQRKKNAFLYKEHISKPDIDNLVIIFMNAMSGIVYHDDNQVWKIEAYKIYSDEPKTTIQIFESSDKPKENLKELAYVRDATL